MSRQRPFLYNGEPARWPGYARCTVRIGKFAYDAPVLLPEQVMPLRPLTEEDHQRFMVVLVAHGMHAAGWLYASAMGREWYGPGGIVALPFRLKQRYDELLAAGPTNNGGTP